MSIYPVLSFKSLLTILSMTRFSIKKTTLFFPEGNDLINLNFFAVVCGYSENITLFLTLDFALYFKTEVAARIV